MTTTQFYVADAQRAVVELDSSQRAVIDLPDGASAAVLGAPGSGKSTTLIELVVDRVVGRGWEPGSVLMLTHGRATATRLRDRVAARLRVVTPGPLARSVNSLAFEVVGAARLRRGEPPARLLTGGDQDFDIAEFLAGHLDEGSGPDWPEPLAPGVRGLRVFRNELRELMMRLTEHRVAPERLSALAAEHGHPEWAAAAEFWREYRDVLANHRPDQLDSAEFAMQAAALIRAGEVPESIAALRLVVVDDLQEATASTVEMLRALAAHGVAIIAAGDPDVATNSFRGGEASLVGRLAAELSVPGLVTLRLGLVHRHGERLRGFVSEITTRIGTAGTFGQREAVASEAAGNEDSPVQLLRAPSAARECVGIAEVLRRRHLAEGVPWRELVVIVRSGAQIPNLVRGLSLADIPTRTSLGGTPLRELHAARGLLTLLEIASGRVPLEPETAEAVLVGAFGGLDRLGLRRLKLALRAEAILAGGRPSELLLAEALQDPARLATIDSGVARAAVRLATILAALREGFESGSSAEELLWLAWDHSGLAEIWRAEALGVGALALEANRNLDGIVALFTAARNFVERQPDRPAGDFLAAVLDADVPEDTLAAQSAGDAVLVTTASGAVGLEFDLVVVSGLQDGVWPNLRPRGSLLHPQRLARVLSGAPADIDARRDVLHDELRMFALAVSRARNRVVLAATVDEESAPSVFFALAPAEAERVPERSRTPSLRGLVGRLRREVVRSGAHVSARQRTAASALARLSAAGVAGAAPVEWHGLLPLSTEEPLYEGKQVRVSPSMLEKLERSALEWFIDVVAGSSDTLATGLGTLVHRALQEVDEPDRDKLWQVVAERWHELDFDAEWMSVQKKRVARGFTDSIAAYLERCRSEGILLAGAEERFTVELGSAVLSGSIDRIEVAPDGAVAIVDLKTGRSVPSGPQVAEHLQLIAYQFAYLSGVLDELLESTLEGREHHAGGAKLLYPHSTAKSRQFTEAIQPPLDRDGEERMRERLIELAGLMNAAAFDDVAPENDRGPGSGWRYLIHRLRAVTSD